MAFRTGATTAKGANSADGERESLCAARTTTDGKKKMMIQPEQLAEEDALLGDDTASQTQSKEHQVHHGTPWYTMFEKAYPRIQYCSQVLSKGIAGWTNLEYQKPSRRDAKIHSK